ncbi:MAG: LysM peptidoglycan-binding domain-containing M23 family metallopeptidase [Ilumatobacteraceae bacterium]
MLPVSEQNGGAGPRSSSTRSRWLFAIIVFVVGIVPVTQIAKAVAPSEPACPGATYSVVSGDSWYRIATNLKISMTALVNANGATTTTVIHPGQTLCLPSGAAAPATTTTTTSATVATTPTAAPSPNGAYAISVFPAQGPCSFIDTYGATRSGGRFHEGVDVIAKAGQWVYAVKDGTLSKQYLNGPASLSGNGWRLTTSDGTYFFYAHLSAFAPGLKVGSTVIAGQIIGQIGMTGNAPIPHLHFEVHPGGGASINPTSTVKAVDGCKTTAVPPQPGGTVPATTVPPATVPPPTGPAPTLPPVIVPAPTTTTTVYVPVDHRRDGTYLDGTERPRR